MRIRSFVVFFCTHFREIFPMYVVSSDGRDSSSTQSYSLSGG